MACVCACVCTCIHTPMRTHATVSCTIAPRHRLLRSYCRAESIARIRQDTAGRCVVSHAVCVYVVSHAVCVVQHGIVSRVTRPGRPITNKTINVNSHTPIVIYVIVSIIYIYIYYIYCIYYLYLLSIIYYI